MNLTKEQAKKNLAVLVERFKLEFESGKTQTYNEEATKTAFIQPLLKDVLGWDVNNNDEVSPEERVSRDRVDYGLKINGKTVMFVEAKSVKADLNKHIEQAVMYGFNRRDVPFIMLTDFEGIMLFDTTIKPNFKNLKKGMKLDIPWKEYVSRFEELWVLSKESVLAGKLDELIKIKPKDRITIDKAILEDLEGWREKLAKDIYKNNHERFNSNDSDKDGTYLKEITQKILDRIIFMRFCEDRNLSNRPTLKSIFAERNEAVGTKAMSLLNEEFKHYNYIFNSDLFGVRDWDSKVIVDIKPLKEIILGTYDPYLFDVIPLEVLGNIYEQYLGYTIKLTEHQAKYELKPEVRKAGGVYYTPKYIVDYIVKNTVGKVLEESTPAKIKKLSILDPACGSGSFLIRAYEEMLNYYRGLKVKGDKILDGQTGFGIRGDGKERELTILEKAEILKRHIYGVDIDEQAVEVTKLSLMLKMLEGEQGLVAGRNVLPMLDKNIKCGNSLISGDSQELFKYFGKDYWKVKPFNWNEEFKQIMVDEGGFDVVVGNPPYIQLSMETGTEKGLKDHLIEKYGSSMGRLNTFGFFIALGIKNIKDAGSLGYIIPNTILTQDYYEKLRNDILSNCAILNITNFEILQFKDAVVENIVLVLKKVKQKPSRDNNKINIYTMSDKDGFLKTQEISQKSFSLSYKNSFNVNINDSSAALKEKIESLTSKLGDLVEINQAIALKHERAKYLANKKIDESYKKVLDGRNINRYSLNWNGEYLKYDIKAIHSCKREDIFLSKEKLFFRRVGNGLIASYDKEQYYALNTLIVINMKISSEYSLKYILALLNSKLLNFYYQKFLKSTKKVFSEIQARQVEQLPFRMIELSIQKNKLFHDKIISLVDIMISLGESIKNAKNNEKDQIQRQIDQTDKEIDELVYKLYGITEEEKKIIEGK
ncbi:MAG: N-6 DNA methylase [Candidatus Firestonebacteria bacterium]|nr:N-6 DNA methylase [Candidatus Firestonebacteria bacterium]